MLDHETLVFMGFVQEELFFQCVFGLYKLTNELTRAHERANQVSESFDAVSTTERVSFAYWFCCMMMQMYDVKRDVAFMPHIR